MRRGEAMILSPDLAGISRVKLKIDSHGLLAKKICGHAGKLGRRD
jgi:hypothetical protein